MQGRIAKNRGGRPPPFYTFPRRRQLDVKGESTAPKRGTPYRAMAHPIQRAVVEGMKGESMKQLDRALAPVAHLAAVVSLGEARSQTRFDA